MSIEVTDAIYSRKELPKLVMPRLDGDIRGGTELKRVPLSTKGLAPIPRIFSPSKKHLETNSSSKQRYQHFDLSTKSPASALQRRPPPYE